MFYRIIYPKILTYGVSEMGRFKELALEREAFEEWCLAKYSMYNVIKYGRDFLFKLDPNKNYWNGDIRLMWMGWKAAKGFE